MNEKDYSTQKIWLKNYPKRIPHHLEYPSVPLFHFIKETAREFPDNISLDFFGKTLTFRELNEVSDKFAAFLQKENIQKGEFVSMLLPNTPQFVIAFWGILKAGCCIQPLNPGYSERELEEILNDCGSRIILSLDVFAGKLQTIKSKTKIEKIVLTNIADYFPGFLKGIMFLRGLPKIFSKNPKIESTFFFKEIISDTKLQASDVKIVTNRDLAVLQYTGGTTGKPKGVMLTHSNLVANLTQLNIWFPRNRGKEIFIGLVPFFHIGGISASIVWGAYWAAKIVILPRFNIKKTLKAITKHKATFFMGVPAIYIAFNEIIKKNPTKYDLSSLTLAGVGTAPCPREIIELYQKEYKINLLEGYGLTENTGVCFQNLPENGPKIGSVGFPFPDTDAKIVDPETGSILGVDKEGELCIKGPEVAIGYLNRPEITSKNFKDGWLHTGDIAKMDKEGYFYILGRKDDVIGVKGFQVYPREIENVIEKTGMVAEVAVVGIPDYYAGKKIIAFVVPKEGKEISKGFLKETCQKNLVEYKVPSEIIIKNELPKSPMRKILRYELRNEAEKMLNIKNNNPNVE